MDMVFENDDSSGGFGEPAPVADHVRRVKKTFGWGVLVVAACRMASVTLFVTESSSMIQ